MFYRRKVILGLFELMGGNIEKLSLQKLLFLYSKKKKDPEYEFIPYKFGCYSYSAKADLNTMVKKGYLRENQNQYFKNDEVDYFKNLKAHDKIILNEVQTDYGHMSNSQLIKHTYINFPFYAISSTIAKDVLSESMYSKVENAIPKTNETCLFTIGYEGISLEKYLQKLIKNNIKLLLDVRKNPLSMKFGFSKTLLKRYAESVGIEYLHIPEVGIESDKRKNLDTQQDYDKLFENYRETTLKTTSHSQSQILELLKKHNRVALTCFEAEPCQCHRTHLAKSISQLKGFEYSVSHL